MNFVDNNDQQEIINALLTGQSKVNINNVELILKPLKRDTSKNREREALKIAQSLLKVL